MRQLRRYLLHGGLLLATFVTMTLAGMDYVGIAWIRPEHVFPHPLRFDWLRWDTIAQHWSAGLPFSLTLIAILFSHEMGHFLTARYYRVAASLPYFVPGPPILIGTFGAFIRMDSAPPNRRALFDIGIAGPWAGFAIALPAAWWGVVNSKLLPLPRGQAFHYFGDSILSHLLIEYVRGPIPPGFDLALHPVAWAAWVGFFVTALNLLPVGQLDGGHMAYSMLGRHHRWLAWPVFGGIVGLGFAGWHGWFVWAVLLSILGVSHPAMGPGGGTLNPLRFLVGLVTLLLLAATLVPVPITLVPPGPWGPDPATWIEV